MFAEGEVIGEAGVYGGTQSVAQAGAGGPVSLPVPTEAEQRIVARIVYEGPVVAPVRRAFRSER